MIKKYKKKPIVIEAVQWTGFNKREIDEFIGKCILILSDGCLLLTTLDEVMHVAQNDYILKGIKGEFYPCKPDIFKQTYEELDEKE